MVCKRHDEQKSEVYYRLATSNLWLNLLPKDMKEEEEESVIMVIKLASTASHRAMTKRCVSSWYYGILCNRVWERHKFSTREIHFHYTIDPKRRNCRCS